MTCPRWCAPPRNLQRHPIAAVDLNLGCPAPIVYTKCAGGGLLREPERIDRILGSLREAVTIPFTVKTRIGFEDEQVFDTLLPIFAKHRIDLLTVHGRTVLQMYRDGVRYRSDRAGSDLHELPGAGQWRHRQRRRCCCRAGANQVPRTHDRAQRDSEPMDLRPDSRPSAWRSR